MDQLINIPRRNTDNFYRYKMPIIKTKVEGKGNGIRTVIVNMGKIMKALDRPLEYGTKFIGFELGTQTKADAVHNNCVVSGKHDPEQLALHLDKFIDMYVLCIKCHNPETILEIKKSMIISKCKACGKQFKIDMGHKLSNFILKTELGKKPTTSKIDDKVPTKTKTDVDDKEKWSMDTSDSAINARKQQLHCEVDAKKMEKIANIFPLDNFIKFMANNPSTDVFVDNMLALRSVQQWQNNVLIKYTFAGLFASSDNIRENFYKNVGYIENFVKEPKEQYLILECVEKFIEENVNQVNNVLHIVNGFYEAELVEEDIIFKWFDSKSKVVSEELSHKIKDNMVPFIKWLEEAGVDDNNINDL